MAESTEDLIKSIYPEEVLKLGFWDVRRGKSKDKYNLEKVDELASRIKRKYPTQERLLSDILTLLALEGEIVSTYSGSWESNSHLLWTRSSGEKEYILYIPGMDDIERRVHSTLEDLLNDILGRNFSLYWNVDHHPIPEREKEILLVMVEKNSRGIKYLREEMEREGYHEIHGNSGILCTESFSKLDHGYLILGTKGEEECLYHIGIDKDTIYGEVYKGEEVDMILASRVYNSYIPPEE